MAEKTTTQSQQKESSKGLFARLAEEQSERADAFMDELDKLEKKRLAQLEESIDEAHKLMKSSVTYASKASTGWRDLMIETTRKYMSMATTSWI